MEEPHDLSAFTSMHQKIVARHELWKYCEITSHTIKEWMSTPFNKVSESLTCTAFSGSKLKNGVVVPVR